MGVSKRVQPGIIYLLHFDRPYKHAQHYLGWSQKPLARLAEHAKGSGSRLVQVVQAAGISWQLVRAWHGTRSDERRLKKSGAVKRQCPICHANPRPVKFLERAS